MPSERGLTYEEEVALIEAERAKPKVSCQSLRTDLKECLLKSDCVTKDGKTPKECLLLGKHPSVPDECTVLRKTFFECKRSLLDMRTRFRGRKHFE